MVVARVTGNGWSNVQTSSYNTVYRKVDESVSFLKKDLFDTERAHKQGEWQADA